MLLHEIMGLGDDNVLGKLFNDAKNTLNKLKSNKETCSLVCGLLDTLSGLEANPNILQTDGHSLTRFLQMLAKPNVDKKTLQTVSDALGSYDDDSSD